MNGLVSIAVAACVFVVALPAEAQSPDGVAAGSAAARTAEPSEASENSAFRARLERQGVRFGTTATSDWSVASTVDRRPVGRLLLDADVTLDLAPLAGMRGTTVFVQFYSKVGDDGATLVTALQPFSNIDAPSFARFGEVWIEQRLAGDRLRLKGGRMDANTEFAGVDVAADFLNSSMGFSPTIVMFPTYPSPRFGGVAAFDPSPRFGLSFGTFTGEAGVCERASPTRAHAFLVGELRTSWSLGGRAGNASVGLWHHTGHVADDHGSSASDRFATLEQTIWQRGDGDAAHVSVFGQYGSAAGESIDRHLAAGLAWHAPFTRRPDDVLGAAVTGVRAQGPAAVSERALALFYRYTLADWIALQPDVQVITNPGGVHAKRAAMAVTVRTQVSF